MKTTGYLSLCCAIILSVSLALTACAKPDSTPQESDVFSEGVDTPITISSYSDLNGPEPYFLREGDKVAVIAASSLPMKEQIEATVEGLRKWGYVPVEGKYVSVEERTLDECVEDLT